MKKFLSTALVLAAIFAGNGLFAQVKQVGQVSPANVSAPMPQTISGRQNLTRAIIALPDMEDADAMQAQLKTIPGVTAVHMDPLQKRATIAYDKVATDIQQISTQVAAKNIKMEVVYPPMPEKVQTAPASKE